MAYIKKPNELNKSIKKKGFGHKLKSLIDNSSNNMATLRKKLGAKRGK
jgi:hypothetical protein